MRRILLALVSGMVALASVGSSAWAEQRGTKVEQGADPAGLETVQGQYCHLMGDDDTPSKAKKTAEARAREAAVASYQVYVQSASTVKNFQMENDVIEQLSAGLLRGAKTTYEEKGREFCASVTAKLDPVQVEERIKQLINAKDIATQAQAPVLPAGSAFGVKVWTNKQPGQPFVEGDPLVIYVQSDREGYLKVDYYQADGQVVHLVPNTFRGEVFVRAGQVYTFGGEGGQEKFTITPPFGNETIKAFVSTQRIDDALSAKRGIEDSRTYLQDLKRGTRGVNVGGGAGGAQWAEAALGLETQDKATEQHVMTRGGTSGIAKMLPVPKGPQADPDFKIVRIFYATDRKPTGEVQPAAWYGGDRGDGDKLELGTCEVSIPKDHRLGSLEAPSILKLEFSEDPKKHVILMRVTPQPADVFYAGLRQRVGQSPRKEAFVFVHGFNVPFSEAARRTAQIAYDLQFAGAPILYSWPSQGKLGSYPVDETNVEWTVPHLKQFLAEVSAKSGAQSIHLIAHSMGNRALTRALYEIALEKSLTKSKFSEVVLTAPDIDADVFARLAKDMSRTAKRITMYGSSKDKALTVSKEFHGYRRAGDTAVITVVPGVDTIDASMIDTSLSGHSYYGDNSSVLTDLYHLLLHGKPPERRSYLHPNEQTGRKYWIFRP